MGLHRLSVGNRLVAGFLIVVLGMVAVTALGVIRVGQVSDRLTVINELNSVKQRYAINFRGSVHDRAISLRDVVLAWTPAEVEGHVADIEKLAGDYAASAEKMDGFFADDTLVTPDEVDAYAVIQGIEAETLPLVDEVIALRDAGDVTAASQLLMTDVAPLFRDWLASINVLIDLEEAKNQAEGAEAREIADGFLLVMVLCCGLAAAFAVTIAWRIARSITGPMSDAVTVFAAVSEGDLTQRLDTASKDGLGELGSYANLALARMGEAMAGPALPAVFSVITCSTSGIVCFSMSWIAA